MDKAMHSESIDNMMERIVAKRKARVEQVVFKFKQDYKVFTNWPYTKWTVRWGCSVIAEYDFPDADLYRPESTVTIARARECFQKATVEHVRK